MTVDYKTPILDKFIWQESVKDKDLTSPPGAPAKGDRYLILAVSSEVIDQENTTYEGDTYITGDYIESQIFTAGVSSWLSKIVLLLYKDAGTDNIVVEIRNVVDNKPGNTVYSSEEILASNLPTGIQPFSEIDVVFSSPSYITSSTKYAIVIYIKNFSGDTQIRSKIYIHPDAYIYGTECASIDAGASWSIGGDYDLYFKTYVNENPWFGKEDYITYYNGATWSFIAPREGFKVYVEDEDKDYKYITSWTESIGQQGNQGATGAKGDQGNQGATGAKGDQGNQGATGAKGDQGNQGATGAKGDQGNQGATGADGDANTKWNQLTITTDFNDQAASTSTITMNSDQTGNTKVGYAIKFKLSGVYYYAICTAIVANLLTIAGAPLTTGDGNLTELYYSSLPGMVEQLSISINGAFADAADTTLLASDLNMYLKWTKLPAYLVMISHKVKTADTGANQPQVNCDLNGANSVSTSNTNAGRAVSTSWVDTVVDINTSNYDINYGEIIEIRTDANGSNDNARDLSVILTFVFA